MTDIVRLIQDTIFYDPRTGEFTWKVSRGRLAKAGGKAGSVNVGGVVYIKVGGKRIQAHRVAYAIMTGRFPPEHIDHIDGNTQNNKWENLRQCTHFENMQNRKASKRNQCGLIGASKHKFGWQAVIAVNKKQHYLGIYKTPEEAHQAYVEAKRKLHTFSPEVRK